MSNSYIHGYCERETQRLNEQSGILRELIHGELKFKPGSHILETGCGVGAQTLILSQNNPNSKIISVDISEKSIQKAKETIELFGLKNVEFIKSDVFALDFKENSFDYVFVCFVLEHLSEPAKFLQKMLNLLKPGGEIILIEGDHEACVWNPVSPESSLTWKAFIKSQQLLGHDPTIGRRLFSLLSDNAYKVIKSEPRWVFADGSKVELLKDVMGKIIVPMTKTGKNLAISNNLIDEKTWDKGINDLEKICQLSEGSFFYSWFRAIGKKEN